jgi:hypothetical protein
MKAAKRSSPRQKLLEDVILRLEQEQRANLRAQA